MGYTYLQPAVALSRGFHVYFMCTPEYECTKSVTGVELVLDIKVLLRTNGLQVNLGHCRFIESARLIRY